MNSRRNRPTPLLRSRARWRASTYGLALLLTFTGCTCQWQAGVSRSWSTSGGERVIVVEDPEHDQRQRAEQARREQEWEGQRRREHGTRRAGNPGGAMHVGAAYPQSAQDGAGTPGGGPAPAPATPVFGSAPGGDTYVPPASGAVPDGQPAPAVPAGSPAQVAQPAPAAPAPAPDAPAAPPPAPAAPGDDTFVGARTPASRPGAGTAGAGSAGAPAKGPTPSRGVLGRQP